MLTFAHSKIYLQIMVSISPFKALRPEAQFAKQVASRPYDVLNSKEAKLEAQGNPSSFLHITKSEIDLPEDIDTHSQQVYDKAKENLDAFISRNILFRENKACYYIYQLIMPARAGSDGNSHSQTGLVCTSSVDDYENGLIKKHEFTRPEKEKDRIDHMKTIGAQTGNVFLAYKNVEAVDAIINEWKKERSPVYDFIADDAIQHSIWVINDAETIEKITALFNELVPCTYIADGHHRAASAAKVRAAGAEYADYFLTTLFPSNQLQIMDYNRVIKDLNGLSPAQLLEKLKENFAVSDKGFDIYKPTHLHNFSMYLDGKWYSLTAKAGTYNDQDPIGVLDVTILSERVLAPLFNITDLRKDKRIDFVGGLRGLGELKKRVDSGEMKVAFALYAVTMKQLIDIADSGQIMPPKTTWFEPKLRSGLVLHSLD